MSGSSGYGGYRARRNNEPLVAESLQSTDEKAGAVELAELFRETVAEINQMNVDELNQHRRTVQEAIQDLFEGVYELEMGGSRSRHTYVNGLSDVDFLIDLGPYSSSTLANKNDCNAVLQEMERWLKQRLPNTEMKVGRMAVTLQFADGHELQVLPAFRYHSAYRIPDPDGTGWVTTNPRRFSDLLRERNKSVGGNLLRTIKLAKLVCGNAVLPIKSYHLENIAVAAFENYTGSRSDSEMLRHLFNQAKTLAARPMRDVTGQQQHVDSYLSSLTDRSALARGLAGIERQISEAGTDPAKWRTILQGE